MVRDRGTARVTADIREAPGTEATTDTRDGETMTVVTFSAAVPARVATAVHLRVEASAARAEHQPRVRQFRVQPVQAPPGRPSSLRKLGLGIACVTQPLGKA